MILADNDLASKTRMLEASVFNCKTGGVVLFPDNVVVVGGGGSIFCANITSPLLFKDVQVPSSRKKERGEEGVRRRIRKGGGGKTE
jgi:hypothetical protein